MRILQLVPGSGGTFYCQNCLRDVALVRALRRQGHDVLMAPLYLPFFNIDMVPVTSAPIFFGGINVYLRELFPFFRKAPRWLSRCFDARYLLRRAAAREGSTSAAGLGSMTLSMLNGRDGNQRQEFDRFLEWLITQEKPDVVHVSNALLLGFVPAIRDALDVPFVCSLQDEEPWVEAMQPPYNRLCWEAMARHAALVGAFISTSAWYAERMRARMNLPANRVHVVYPGIETENIAATGPRFDPPTIGFLSRINEAQGFGDLVDAFVSLRRESALAALRLTATGGATPHDRPFIESIEAQLTAAGMRGAVDIRRDFQTAPAPDFFAGLSVLSTPVHGGEAFGMQIVEALARGVPVVQPRVGAYPEIVEATNGGLLYDASKEGALADALRTLLCDRDRAKTLGVRGRAAVLERFNIDRAARDAVAVYASVASGGAR